MLHVCRCHAWMPSAKSGVPWTWALCGSPWLILVTSFLFIFSPSSSLWINQVTLLISFFSFLSFFCPLTELSTSSEIIYIPSPLETKNHEMRFRGNAMNAKPAGGSEMTSLSGMIWRFLTPLTWSSHRLRQRNWSCSTFFFLNGCIVPPTLKAVVQ